MMMRDFVKINVSEDDDDNKIGFIGKIVNPPETLASNPSGLFSIYGLEDNQIIGYGDYTGSELLLIGGKISRDDLKKCMDSKLSSMVMIDELQKLFKKLYEGSDL